MYLNICWPNLSHAFEDTKYISTSVNQTPPMPARAQKFILLVLNSHAMLWVTQNASHLDSKETKFISTCVDQTYPILARAQNVS